MVRLKVPLAEFIEDGLTERLNPVGDVAVLASTIRDLWENENKRESLGYWAIEWVNRTGAAVTEPLPQLYHDLILARSA